MSLSQAEAQNQIFRSWARLSKAMEVGEMMENSAHEWERNMLREVHTIFTAVVKGPPGELVIPPLAHVLLDAQRCPTQKRPIVPADIQARLVSQDSIEVRLPDLSSIDLGDPSTFWWVGLGKARVESANKGKRKAPDEPESHIAASNHHPLSESQRTNHINTLDELTIASLHEEAASSNEEEEDELGDGQSSVEHEVGSSSRRPVKQRRVQPYSSHNKVMYKYVPKCRRCREYGRICTVQTLDRGGWGRCDPCKVKKSGCSACSNPGAYRIVNITNNLEPQNHPSQNSSTTTTLPVKVGPPGGKWKWEKRVEKATTRTELGAVTTATSSTGVNTETRSYRSCVAQTDLSVEFQGPLLSQLIQAVNNLRDEIVALTTEIKHGSAAQASIDAPTIKLEE